MVKRNTIGQIMVWSGVGIISLMTIIMLVKSINSGTCVDWSNGITYIAIWNIIGIILLLIGGLGFMRKEPCLCK